MGLNTTTTKYSTQIILTILMLVCEHYSILTINRIKMKFTMDLLHCVFSCIKFLINLFRLIDDNGLNVIA